MRVSVVGAGISGLLCAQRLAKLAPGLQVSVFEWGRGPGGRTARRRVKLEDGTELSFDHSAPFFSATTNAFRDILAQWEAKGVAKPWGGAGGDIWVGTPSNHAIAKGIVSSLENAGASMHFGQHVLAAAYKDREWRVQVKDRASKETSEFVFDALVLSDKLLVLPNTYSILEESEAGMLSLPHNLTSAGAIVMLLALERLDDGKSILPVCMPGWHQKHSPRSSILKLVLHENSKPGRDCPDGLDLWVVHSTAEYAASHLVGEALDDQSAVLAEMKEAFLGPPGGQPDRAVAHASVMAWDHAQPSSVESPLLADEQCRVDAGRRAGVCGDFFGPTSGVEAAALSGVALADALAPLLQQCDNSVQTQS